MPTNADKEIKNNGCLLYFCVKNMRIPKNIISLYLIRFIMLNPSSNEDISRSVVDISPIPIVAISPMTAGRIVEKM